MTELNPPSWLQNGCYTAQGDRSVVANLVCEEGVAYGLTATATGTSRNVVISEGGAFIEGENAPGQGMYSVANVGTRSLTIAAPDLSDPRIDLIVARVYDSQYLGSTDVWALEVVQGVASPSPTAPGTPTNAVPLWQVRANPGSTNIGTADLTDVRESYVSCSDSEYTLPVLSLERSSAMSLNAGAEISVSWDTQIKDTRDMWQPGNPTEIIIPEDGTYFVSSGYTLVGGASGGQFVQYFRRNGSLFRSNRVPAGDSIGPDLSVFWDFEAGDVLDIRWIQTSSVTRGVQVSPGFRPYLQVSRLAE